MPPKQKYDAPRLRQAADNSSAAHLKKLKKDFPEVTQLTLSCRYAFLFFFRAVASYPPLGSFVGSQVSRR